MPNPIGAIDFATLLKYTGGAIPDTLDNPVLIQFYGKATAPGGVAGTNVAFYTVPTGKRAMHLGWIFNANLTALNIYNIVTISAVVYRRGGAAAITARNNSAINSSLVFEAGDVVGINIAATSLALTQVTVAGGTVTYTGTITGGAASAYAGKTFVIEGFANAGNNITFTVTSSTATTLVGTTSTQVNETHAGTACEQSGLNFSGYILQFDDTSKLKSARKVGAFTNGDNTIYTVPVGKRALVAGYISPLASIPGGALGGGQPGIYVNTSGSTSTIKTNVVLSGDTPSDGTIVNNNQNATVANLGAVQVSVGVILNAGDYISFNTNQTGTQVLILLLIEF